MRWTLALLLTFFAATAFAERILLVPLDSRPAAGQFPQLIGNIAGIEVKMPPYETLGRFTTQGSPDRILDWLEDQDLTDVSSLIVSTDMICYGGLIASRVYEVSTSVAMRRVQRLLDIKRRTPKIKLYLFSSTMRLAPTETRRDAAIREKLGRYEEVRDMADRTGDRNTRAEASNLKKFIPAEELEQYDQARARDHAVQRLLIKMTKDTAVDFLVIGQDDARQYGPHVKETADLRQYVRELDLDQKVYFCEGVDQDSSVLLSRALLKEANWSPRVKVVYSDENGKGLYASYESIKIEDSLKAQIIASGAQPAVDGSEGDYTLYLNTPSRRESNFQLFLSHLRADLSQDLPVAVADINLSRDGTGDPELYTSLWGEGYLRNLISYAGWNTAGNTMGTAIPAANVYMLAKRDNVPPLVREVAQREFLIHRFVDDYAYHKYTRASAYTLIVPNHHEEIYGDEWDEVNTFVSRDLQKQLNAFFNQGFLNRTFVAGDRQYRFSGVTGVKVWLPWPRPYEVRLEFHLQVVAIGIGTSIYNH